LVKERVAGGPTEEGGKTTEGMSARLSSPRGDITSKVKKSKNHLAWALGPIKSQICPSPSRALQNVREEKFNQITLNFGMGETHRFIGKQTRAAKRKEPKKKPP